MTAQTEFPPPDLMAKVEQNVSLIPRLPLTVQQAVQRKLQEKGWTIARDQFGPFYLRPSGERDRIVHQADERCFHCSSDGELAAAYAGRQTKHVYRWDDVGCPSEITEVEKGAQT